MKKWWIVWRQIEGDEIYAISFDHEPQNEDIAGSSANGYNMIGYPVQAESEAEAIEKAEASEENE